MADDLGFVPDAQPPQAQDDLGFIPSDPNMSPAKSVLMGNYKTAQSEAKSVDGKPPEPDVHPAKGFLDDWMSGWQMSTTALGITRQKLPDTVLPEDAGRFARILSMAGQTVGDLPAMIAGGVGGGVAGEMVGGKIGAKLGAQTGAFALPAALRQVLVDHYKKGDIQNFEDFYDRASGAFLAGLKGGVTGLATGAAGMGAGALMPAAASPFIKMAATTAAEGSVMTTVGKALDGKMPSLSDFGDTAILLAGMHAAVGIAEPIKGKLMDVYAKTGLKPSEVNDLAGQDPILKQQLLSKDPDIPQSLKEAQDPGAIEKPQVTIQPDMSLTKSVDGLASFKPDLPDETIKAEKLSDKNNPSLPNETEPKERSAAVNSVLDRIGETPDAPKEKMDFDKFYYNILDDKDPLKNMTKSLLGEEALGTKEDPYGLARSMGSVTRKADEIIENGPRDFNTLEKTGTPGLKGIWEKADDLKELRAYQIAKHSIDLENNGVKTGVDINAAKSVVRELGPKYKDIAKENVKFNNDNIDYLVKSGVLDSDKAQIMKDKWQNYSAMNRVMGTDEQGSSGSGSGMQPYNPIKSIEGSERQLIDPLQSNIKNTHQIIAMAERNRVMRAVTDLIDKQLDKGDESWGTKVRTPMNATELNSGDTIKILKAQGFDPSEAKDLSDVSTIFRADRSPLEDNQIASYKDGKRQVYEVPQGVADAVKGMDSQTAGLLMKMLSPPSRVLREGMMSSPAFAIRHFFRQEAMAASMSKDLQIPVYHTIKGLMGMNDDSFGDWIMHGGGGDSIASIDNDYIKSKIYDLNDETGFMDNAWNKTKTGLQFAKHAIELTDEARTFQKYQNRKAAGIDPWQAQFDARDTGIDVQRSGAAMAAYSRLDPFQNIRVQGLDLIGRRLTADPVGTAAKLLATVTIPSLVLWAHNHDKDWYQQLTDQDRDTNWHFPVGDPDNGGHVVRVPKPFEPGVVFGALPERLMDAYIADNPGAFKNFSKTIKDSVAPGYIPTFAQPAIEAFANKSLLTGSPLIGKNMEDVLPKYQTNPYTSDTAKVVASGLRLIPSDLTQKPGGLGSPIIVDNFIKNWTGGAGQLVLSATDKILEKSGLADAVGVDYNHNPPESVWSDNPFLRSFVVRYPSTNTKAIGDFFDRSQQAQTVANTIKQQQNTLNFTEANLVRQQAFSDGNMVQLSGIKKAISEQMSMIQKVTVMPGMDPHQKRQAIDQYATIVNKEAALGNTLLDTMDKARGAK